MMSYSMDNRKPPAENRQGLFYMTVFLSLITTKTRNRKPKFLMHRRPP